jgi:hypothetical protein
MERVAMASLSLREAAEQTGTSKVDIWCAIQAGKLPAKKTDDGGFAIDPAELFGVFEPQRRHQCPAGQDTTASPTALGSPETGATPHTAAASDVAVAFAALQLELRGLLAGVGEPRSNDELRADKDEDRDRRSEHVDAIADKADPLREEAAAGAKSANPAIAETTTPIPSPTNRHIAEKPSKQPWWRQLMG